MSVGYDNGTNNPQQNTQAGDPADWDTLKNDMGDIAGTVVQRGRHFLDSAREQAAGYVDHRKDNVAQSVADLAHSLRESTSSFSDRPNIRAFVDSAAEGLDQFADSIRERTFTDIFNDVEDVMRERPAVVAAVSVAVGFLTARFVKSSAEGLRQGHDPYARADRRGTASADGGGRGRASQGG